jgi:hypothetical protein
VRRESRGRDLMTARAPSNSKKSTLFASVSVS